MIQIFFWIVVVITGFLSAYTGRYQAITLWAGKKIVDPDLAPELPNGVQDAITPQMQSIRNVLNTALWTSILVFGTILKWYFGILGIGAAIFIQVIAERVIPNKVEYYLISIINSLNNRMADYYKKDDMMRGDAAKEFFERLQHLYGEIRGSGMKVPKFNDVKKMPLGRSN